MEKLPDPAKVTVPEGELHRVLNRPDIARTYFERLATAKNPEVIYTQTIINRQQTLENMESMMRVVEKSNGRIMQVTPKGTVSWSQNWEVTFSNGKTKNWIVQVEVDHRTKSAPTLLSSVLIYQDGETIFPPKHGFKIEAISHKNAGDIINDLHSVIGEVLTKHIQRDTQKRIKQHIA